LKKRTIRKEVDLDLMFKAPKYKRFYILGTDNFG